MIQITPNLTINEADIEQEFVRASGPGRQNVKIVATVKGFTLVVESPDAAFRG